MMNQNNLISSDEVFVSPGDMSSKISFGNTTLDGIIFDVDGTLWDSTEQAAQVWTRAVQENTDLGTEVSADQLRRLFGKTMTEISNALFPTLSEKEQERIMEACYEYENEYLETHPGVLYEGVLETFHVLAKKADLYIVSNCQCGYIELFLRSSGLESCVRDHLCFGETSVSKGQTIRMLMENNGLEHVVYVGDTQGDADACREAGIPFILAEYGFGEVPDAEQRIRNISELCEILK